MATETDPWLKDYQERINAIATDALTTIASEIDTAFFRAQRQLDNLERDQPHHTPARTPALLKTMTGIALSKAGITDPGVPIQLIVPSVFCEDPPLIIDAVPAGSSHYPLSEAELNQQLRWHISVNNGHQGTWRDERGIVTESGRFIPANHDQAPDGNGIDAILHQSHWRPKNMEVNSIPPLHPALL